MAADWDLVLAADRAIVGDQERPVRLGIKDGRIATLDADGTPDVTLADDEVLLPGLVDTHVHVNEPGRTDWEGYASATRAAAAGGVTTLLDMPLNSIPPTTTVANLRTKQAAARDQVWIDTGFWGGAIPANTSPGNAGDLAALHEAGVFGFKCFLLPSGVDEFPPLDADGLAQAMGVLAGLDALLIAHAEDEHEIREPAGPAYADFLASRPQAAEQRAIDLVIDTARRTGGRAHVVHLASGDALPAIRAARAEGVRLTIETCPHYLTFTADEVGQGHTEFKCCPPIRDDANRAELWRALADGDIDLVVSDLRVREQSAEFSNPGRKVTLQVGHGLAVHAGPHLRHRRGIDAVRLVRVRHHPGGQHLLHPAREPLRRQPGHRARGVLPGEGAVTRPVSGWCRPPGSGAGRAGSPSQDRARSRPGRR